MGVVHEALSQDIELSMGRHDRGVLDGLIRQWRSADASGRAAITAEFRDLLFAADVKRRSAAVLFFARLPADDGGALLAALQEHPERFEHEPDPWFGAGELRTLVAEALSKRLHNDEERTFLESEAMRPGLGHCVIPGLLETHRVWVLQQVGAIVTATPEALATYLTLTTEAERGQIIAAAREALLPEVFEGVVRHHVADAQLREAALGA